MPSYRSGARLLVDQLLIQGVNHAFCVPGESYLAVLDALHDSREMIKLVVNRHESGATFMADAYAKLTGQPGVAFVTRGPGACNAAIGIHTAFQDSTPLVVFVGQVGGNFVEREAFQDVDYRRMFGQMTKWVAQIDRADRVPELVARAFQTATSGRPGPVVLALPEDMLTTPTGAPVLPRIEPVVAWPAPGGLSVRCSTARGTGSSVSACRCRTARRAMSAAWSAMMRACSKSPAFADRSARARG